MGEKRACGGPGPRVNAHMRRAPSGPRSVPRPPRYHVQVSDPRLERTEQVVEGLNAQAFRSAEGEAWTVASFEAEMARLGA